MVITPAVEQLIALALEEDLGRGDVTSEAIFDAAAECGGRILGKEPPGLAGGEGARAVVARGGSRGGLGAGCGPPSSGRARTRRTGCAWRWRSRASIRSTTRFPPAPR